MRELIWKPVRAARLQDLDPITQDRLAASILENYRTWKSNRRGEEEVWQAIDRHVNQYDPVWTPEAKAEIGIKLQQPNGFGSKLKMTNVYAHREGIVANMMKYLMSNDYDFFDPIALDPLDQEALASIKQYLMWLFDIMDFEAAFTPFCRDIVQYGTGIASYEWHREIQPRWRREYLTDPVSGIPMVLDYEAQETVYDAPKFIPMNLYYTVIDPTAPNIKTATLIYKKAVTPHELLANPAYTGVDTKSIAAASDFGGNEDHNWETEREHARGNYTFVHSQAYQGKKEVYEAWGDFSDGVNLYKNYVAEIMNNRLIRFEPNPYMMPHKPFVVARYTVETGRTYGHSPLASITGIQAGYDTAVNQYLDYWNMEINRPVLVEANTIVRTAKDNTNKLPPISKDVAWTVRNKDGVKRLDWGGNSRAMDPTPILNLLASQMEKATGDNAMMSGGAPDRYVKTGVAMTAADAGNSKMNMYAKTIEKEGIVPVLEMTVDLLRQMNVPQRTFKRKDTPGEPEVLFNPAHLASQIKFSMRGASYNMTKQLQVQALQGFLTWLQANPVTMQIVNWVRAVKVFGEALGLRNTQELITPEAEQILQTMPSAQPNFFAKVGQFFAGKGGGTPANLEDTPLGNQLTMGAAPAFGGTNPETGQPSPFDYVSQR